MKLVKAEILWTRKCPLSCSYCNMVNDKENTMTRDEWYRGLDNLKELGCEFAAFYGAEPLYDFGFLPEVVGYAEKIGIYTTVITGGLASGKVTCNKLRLLKEGGATSLSVSYDLKTEEDSSIIKSNRALPMLKTFRGDCGVQLRDIAAITTLTRKNLPFLFKSIKDMTAEGIWTLFDFIHWDREQLGSKCKGSAKGLRFVKDDVEQVIDTLKAIMNLKALGYKVHTSQYFVDLIEKNPELLLNYNWNCAASKYNDVFPSWVTVDCDGKVRPCDDFDPPNVSSCRIDDLTEAKLKELSLLWKKEILLGCPGCLWNTHIDAHAIKLGEVPFSDYVHTE